MKLAKALGAVCLTPACQQMGAQLLKNLSPNHASLDPCTDFEELACGGWREHHELGPDRGRITTLGLMETEADDRLRAILEGPYPGESSHSHFSHRNLDPPTVSLDEQNFNKMQRAYNACMDVPMIEAVGVKPIIDILDELQSVFKPESESLSWPQDLSSLAMHAQRNSILWPVDLDLGRDPRDPHRFAIHLMPERGIGLQDSWHYLEMGTVSEYQTAIAHILSYVHPTGANKSRAAEWAEKVVDFETKIAEIVLTLEQHDASTPVSPILISVADVDDIIPQLKVKKIIRASVPKNSTAEDRGVFIWAPGFFRNFSTLLNETDPETLEWYFNWKAIESWEDCALANNIFQPWRRLQRRLEGQDADSGPERWRTCLDHVSEAMGWILARFFVQDSFGAKARELSSEIIAELRTGYIEKIGNQDWLNQSVKDAAVDKIHRMGQKIGYPEESPNITDPAELQKGYDYLEITDYYHANVKAIRVEEDSALSDIDDEVPRRRWRMKPYEVNAYYSPSDNEIVLPAAILRPPLFSAELPSYINYGGFGSVAGHELSHAFDDEGRRFDAEGRFDQVDWWTEDSLKEYERRAQCFVDQYDHYTVPVLIDGRETSMNINGSRTLGDNLADSAGLSVSYSTWRAKYGTETGVGVEAAVKDNELLPGFGKTVFTSPERMFFLAYANIWCSKASLAENSIQVQKDEHAPGSVRLKGTLRNSRPFLEAFDCPVKEPQCELW